MTNHRKKEYVVSYVNDNGYEILYHIQALDEHDAFEKFVSAYGDNYLINYVKRSIHSPSLVE